MTAMNHDQHPKQVHEPDRRTGRRRSARPSARTAPTPLRVKSLGGSVTETQALNSADVLVLLSEDCCWQATMDDWRRRRPPFWRRGERRAWRADGQLIGDKARRLRELATELGLAPTSRAGWRSRLRRTHRRGQ